MNTQKAGFSRRSFIKRSAIFGGLAILPSNFIFGQNSSNGIGPNSKLNLAVIGIGNQGWSDLSMLHGTGHCNVVALCDVDLKGDHTQQAQGKFPKAKTFNDFRKMFDEMADEIDAVLVATPDHSHFVATALAVSLGKHVFVEKPMAHTFGQTERLIQLAAKNPKVVTQMGNQGFSGANYFQFKAWAEAGLIKDISRITAHMNNPRRWHDWGATISEYPKDEMPDGLDWDQWIDSVAAEHPYSEKLHPQEWRSWYDYGSGCFGDWGPHVFDSCHHFLKLGMPEKIIADLRDGVNQSDLVFPQATTIRFEFAERGPGLPACTVNWYDGVDNMPVLEGKWNPDGKDKKLTSPGKVLYGEDIVFQGGSHGSALRIMPREKFIEMRDDLPKFPLKNSNHYENFLLACKGEEEARSPFSISGPLTQVFNLGVLSQRFGGELTFNSEKQEITNNAAANALLDPAPRKGWEQFYEL